MLSESAGRQLQASFWADAMVPRMVIAPALARAVRERRRAAVWGHDVDDDDLLVRPVRRPVI